LPVAGRGRFYAPAGQPDGHYTAAHRAAILFFSRGAAGNQAGFSPAGGVAGLEPVSFICVCVVRLLGSVQGALKTGSIVDDCCDPSGFMSRWFYPVVSVAWLPQPPANGCDPSGSRLAEPGSWRKIRFQPTVQLKPNVPCLRRPPPLSWRGGRQGSGFRSP